MAAEDSGASEKLVHELLCDYVAHLELGETPSLADYEPRLGTAEQRQELRDLVQALDQIDAQLPAWIGPDVLVARRYKILRELGHGGLGRVWLAHDQKNDRQVAIKVQRFPGPKHEGEKLLRRDRGALVRLHHPNIVTFLDSDQWRDCFYLVMEVVDGTSMKDVLDELRRRRRDGSASWRDQRALVEAIRRPVASGRQDLIAGRSYHGAVAAIMAACACALECTHAANVVHRDLKPGNVMLTGGGNPVLLDFGIAALRDALHGSLSNKLFGTPGYLAPEQAMAGKLGADPRSDLYQLGTMLYELLTLKSPWEDEPQDQVVAAIRDQQLPRARSIDAAVPFELDCICRRAMARDPTHRYQDATELRLDLERFLGGRWLPDAAVDSAPFTLRCRYFVRRRGLWIAAAVLVIVATIVVLLRLL